MAESAKEAEHGHAGFSTVYPKSGEARSPSAYSVRSGFLKQRKFVKFDDKVFGYPRLIAKVKGLPMVDLSGLKPAQRIIQDGKELRDAIGIPQHNTTRATAPRRR